MPRLEIVLDDKTYGMLTIIAVMSGQTPEEAAFALLVGGLHTASAVVLAVGLDHPDAIYQRLAEAADRLGVSISTGDDIVKAARQRREDYDETEAEAAA